MKYSTRGSKRIPAGPWVLLPDMISTGTVARRKRSLFTLISVFWEMVISCSRSLNRFPDPRTLATSPRVVIGFNMDDLDTVPFLNA